MEYEKVKNLITSRFSWYPAQMKENEKIPNESIKKLLELANYAPNHKRTEPWRFVVFSEEKVNDFYHKLANIYTESTPEESFDPKKVEKLNARASRVSHVVAIVMKRDEKERVPIQEEEYAVACAVQNILLGASSLNIIGYWGTGKIAFSEEMKSYLKLREEDKCMGFLQFGVPMDNLPTLEKKPMSPIEEKITWV